MAIVYQHDKRSGITYAYESESHWDKEKKQSRAKRKLIGRVDKQTGKIVPTDGRGKRRGQKGKQNTTGKDEERKFYGAIHLLNEIGKKLGIEADLKQCFPDDYNKMLSIIYYLILENASSLSRFDKWCRLHEHPWGKRLPSQRISELFASIREGAKNKFFQLQGRRRRESEYWAYDTTSISSFSKQLKQVQYGKNKEHDHLPQINLALVFGETTNLPFYYRKLAGNIPDTKTLQHLLADLDLLGFSKVKLVMDRGFYSRENVNGLYKNHLKFLLSVRMNLRFVRNELDKIYDHFRHFEYYNEAYQLYAHTVRTQWEYTQVRPYKGDTLKGHKRIYIHYYYNIDKAAEDEKNFDKDLMDLKREIESGQRVAEHERRYKKFFTIKTTPKRGIKVTVNEEAVQKAKRYFGFFALISNETMDAITALAIYRNKDLVEKAFGNLKERLNMRRTLVSSEKSLDGKLFVQFVALIYLSYIKKQMEDQDLFKSYTLQGVLDQLDVIECFKHPGKKLRVGEILSKQLDLYSKLGVLPPDSL